MLHVDQCGRLATPVYAMHTQTHAHILAYVVQSAPGFQHVRLVRDMYFSESMMLKLSVE